MNEGQKKIAMIGGGIAGLLLLAGWASSGKSKAKRMYNPGDEIDALMGTMFVVRLPRSRYEIIADQVKFIAAFDRGNFTDVTMIVSARALPYTEAVRFVDRDKPGTEYMVTVSAKEIPGQNS